MAPIAKYDRTYTLEELLRPIPGENFAAAGHGKWWVAAKNDSATLLTVGAIGVAALAVYLKCR